MLSEETHPFSNYQKLPELQKFLSDNSITEITHSFCSDNYITLCHNSPNFVIYNTKTKVAFIPTSNKQMDAKATAVSISPCGRYAVSGHENGQIMFWDISRKSLIVDTTIGSGAGIVAMSFLMSWKNLIVVQEDGNITKLDISSLLLFLYVKESSKIQIAEKPLNVICAASCDNSIQFVAVSTESTVIIYQLNDDEKFVKLFDIKADHPNIAFICEEWHFFLAIGEKTQLSILKIYENGSYEEINSFNLENLIKDMLFISRALLVVSTIENLLILNIHDDIISEYSDENNDYSICVESGIIYMVPYGFIKIETFEEKIKSLIHNNNPIQAIKLAVSIYTGESTSYDCYNLVSKLQELLKWALLSLAGSDDLEDNYQLIAEAIVKVDIADYFIHDFLSIKNDKDDQLINDDLKLQLLVSMLKTENVRPETSSLILREIAQLEPVERTDVENALMNVQFTPSFLKEAIGIGNSLHYNRFVLHLFDRFFGDILPVFALIVDTGTQTQISELCKYVFLTNSFDKFKSNLCLIWLHAPGTGRLEKIIESSWENSSKLLKEFLSRTPIKFSSSQQLTDIEIIRIVSLCFGNAKSPDADDLFSLIAQESIEKNIRLPSKAISSIIKYIFESSASRSIRERFFLKIINIDYPQINADQFKEYCVRSGFSTAIQQLLRGDEDFKLNVQCRLLSDNPISAFDVIEKYTGTKEKAQDTILALFKPLLYLDSKRTVKLIINKYPKLHPNQIMATSRKQDIKLYFDTLFEINDPPIVTSEDTQTYLRFLASHISYLVTFLRTAKTLSMDVAFEYCEFHRIHIGCAVLNCMNNNFQSGFDSYQSHVQSGGFYDDELTHIFLNNLDSIKYATPVVLRTLFEPLVTQDSNDVTALKDLINEALEKTTKNDVLIATYSLLLASPSGIFYNCLKEFVTKNGCFIELTNQESIDFFTSICDVIPTRNDIFSDDTVVVRDYNSMDVVVISSIAPKCRTKEMNEHLSAKAHAIVQHAEVLLMINKMEVPRDGDATIILYAVPN